MCGIVSLCYGQDNPRLGFEGGELLKRLEYRGYDSTGGGFVAEDRSINLLKAVGAPSRVVPDLGIDRASGQRFIGQVRWATYGAVTQENCQPHQMACRLPFLGAHNGNISNTDALKTFLADAGHTVVSDNDGEMITHLTEHYYAQGLADAAVLTEVQAAATASGIDVPDTALLLIEGARRADAQADGSYAAAFCDPASPGVVAVKSGSSLYAGIGSDGFGEFVVVSSDLTSVLSKTQLLIPFTEGQGVWFTENRYVVFNLAGPLTLSVPAPKRSRLGVHDTALRPEFEYYMDQEISSVPENLDAVARYYLADASDALAPVVTDQPDAVASVIAAVQQLGDATDEASLLAASQALADAPVLASVAHNPTAAPLVSDERALLADATRVLPGAAASFALADRLLVAAKRHDVLANRDRLVADLKSTYDKGGRIFLVASGTSYHAALVGAYFFNGLAGISVIACNPGMFRSMYLGSLTPRDTLVGITQSGETKDLVDIYLDAAAQQPAIRRVTLVNNENSRIPQELSDYYLPLLCGPEIAVAATKSFVSQLAVLYVLACAFTHTDAEIAPRVSTAKRLVSDTLTQCSAALDAAAERLFQEPSMHLLGTSLIGIAREGALKIREVVLNHAEGYDAAEFKHGPNTILGKNTIFSIDDLGALLDAYEAGRPSARFTGGRQTLTERPELLEGLFSNYPLLFVCPPDARDQRITISQIHTHKIRGANVLLLAESDAALTAAVEGRPAGVDDYWAQCIDLPPSGDPNLFVFSASVALQRLAFRMSELKMQALDALGVRDHGVHPDAPKNVSKSITVD
ncbi:MAG TPA: SIS domain-containing protein [Propioniciclava tarda]|nr:SIS domain-containing protein [Propioniciclava tarda]